jgi:hypothetical protein
MPGIIESKFAEMSAHSHGWLDRSPETVVAILADLAARILPGSVLAASAPSICGSLSADAPWRALDALVPALLAIESKAGIVAQAASVDVLQAIAAEIGVMGFGARHQERFFDALKALIARTIALSARPAAVQPANQLNIPVELPPTIPTSTASK